MRTFSKLRLLQPHCPKKCINLDIKGSYEIWNFFNRNSVLDAEVEATGIDHEID